MNLSSLKPKTLEERHNIQNIFQKIKNTAKKYVIFDTNNTNVVTFNPLMYNDPKWSDTKTSKMVHFAIIVKGFWA